MRIVTTPNFCKACIEGLWLSLLRRVDLIDGVRETCEWRADEESTSMGHWVKLIDIDLVPLAQFRSDAGGSQLRESYSITWRRGKQPLEEFTNQTRLEIDGDAVGTYWIGVDFTTEEVRVDKDKLLSSEVKYAVKDNCGTS